MKGNTISESKNQWSNYPVLVEQIFELSPDCMIVLSINNHQFLHVNKRACILFGYSKKDFMKVSIKDLFGTVIEFQKMLSISANNRVGETSEIEVMGKRATGSVMFMRLIYSRIDEDRALVVIKDISEQQQTVLLNKELSEIVDLQEKYNQKIQIGRQVLKMAAKQQDLKDILDVLCQGIERLVEGLRASILLARDGVLHFGAAPSMPQSFINQVDGAIIAADSLPCGVAVYGKEEVLVEDLMNSERFEHYQTIAKEYQIRSCWSIPILSSSGGQVLGSFAFYSKDIQQVDFSLTDLMAMATDLAAVAIEQANNRDRLTAINQRYAQQNRELEEAKKELEEDKGIVLDREEKLKDAQRLSKVGSWELDLIKNTVTWSKQQYLIYELEDTMEVDLYIAYQGRIYPDDIDNLMTSIANVEYPATIFNYEHRLLCKDKELRYILGTGRVEYNKEQEVIRIKGTEQDVTDLKVAEQRALYNELQFNELMANINEILFMIDIEKSDTQNHPFSYINGDTFSLFGYTQEELMENPKLWSDCIHPEDKEEVIEQGVMLYLSKKKVTREYRFKHKEGHYIWIEDNISVSKIDDTTHWRVYGSARDITQRKASEVASLEINERLELAKNAANLGNYDWKLKEDDLHWDNRMYELFGLEEGLSAEERHLAINGMLHPEDRDRVLDTFYNNIELESIYNFQTAYRICIKDKIKYIENYVILMRDEEGKVDRVIGTCLDATERKEAEKLLISNEEKDVLLKEIHHRVKNNLQVITSLLSLQSSSLEDEEQRKIFADSQYRINSMAIVHELLYQSDNLSKVDYKDYLQQLSQYLIRSIKGTENKIQLDLDVPSIKLSIDTAIPLGLLINEVLTNSLKYGIKGDNTGCISIKITKAPSSQDNQAPCFILEIGDDGIGYSDTINHYNSKSLGLKLIHNLTRQLEGSICKDADKKGTNYIIAFKEI